MSNYVQCNLCRKRYSNQRGLLIHLGYCRERHYASEQNDAGHHIVDHHPLKSCYDQGEHLNPFALYDDEFDVSSSDSLNSNCEEEQEERGVGGTYLTEDDDLADYQYDDTNGQCSTAISKLQIRLNDVIK